MSHIFANLQAEQHQQQATLRSPSPDKAPTQHRPAKRKGTTTQAREKSRTNPRGNARDHPRRSSRGKRCDKPRDLPTRDAIQLFSFHLRDQLKAKGKVQAEVPLAWQDELETLARQLNVKKLELYRYILGAFLGKTGQGRGDRP